MTAECATPEGRKVGSMCVNISSGRYSRIFVAVCEGGMSPRHAFTRDIDMWDFSCVALYKLSLGASILQAPSPARMHAHPHWGRERMSFAAKYCSHL